MKFALFTGLPEEGQYYNTRRAMEAVLYPKPSWHVRLRSWLKAKVARSGR